MCHAASSRHSPVRPSAPFVPDSHGRPPKTERSRPPAWPGDPIHHHVAGFHDEPADLGFTEGDPATELWVRRHASAVLAGRATQVAGAIRRQATNQHLDPARRAGADTAATYLTNKRAYLDYPTALERGWPIATGVIEGACRHLVKDRMDITGARWGLPGAEAILKLRAIRSNGDWDEYWPYHLRAERQRVHQSRYASHVIPQAA
jgi:hypothetical protein